MEPERSRPNVDSNVGVIKPKLKGYPTEPSTTYLPGKKNYSQEGAILLGIVLLALGFIGLAANGFLHAHLSFLNNSLHVISGAISIWFGIDNFKNAKINCLIWGFAYICLGTFGFFFGRPGIPTVGHLAQDNFLWRILPRMLELGLIDHLFHSVIGVFFFLTGFIDFKGIKKI
jgi:hypothetical protein